MWRRSISHTIREQILASIHTLLGGVSGVTVFRNRAIPVEADDPSKFPMVCMFDEAHTVNNTNAHYPIHSMDVRLELHVRAPDNVGSEMNDLYGRVVEALLVDYSLDGLAIDFREAGLEDVVLDTTKPANPLMSAILRMEIDYPQADGDPFSPPL